MQARVTERTVTRTNGAEPTTFYAVETEVYPGAGWVEISRTGYPTTADYLVRAIRCYEKYRDQEQ